MDAYPIMCDSVANPVYICDPKIIIRLSVCVMWQKKVSNTSNTVYNMCVFYVLIDTYVHSPSLCIVLPVDSAGAKLEPCPEVHPART